jgi:hypothetical protein
MLRGGLMTLIGILLLFLVLYYVVGGPFVRQSTYPVPATRVPENPPTDINHREVWNEIGNFLRDTLTGSVAHHG